MAPNLLELDADGPKPIEVGHVASAHLRRAALPTLMESLPPTLAILMEAAMKLAIAIFVVGLAFDAYAIIAGNMHGLAWFGSSQLNPAMAAMDHDERLKILNLLHTFGMMLAGSGIYLAIYTFVSAYELRDRFIGLAVVWALCYFGGPMLFAELGLVPNPNYNLAAATMLNFITAIGDACIVLVAVRLVAVVVGLMRNGVQTVRVAAKGRKAKPTTGLPVQRKPAYRVIRRCWELGYCQEILLKVCPAWQRKKTCWKHGSGCMCDASMIDRLIQVDMAEAAGKSLGPAAASTAPKGMKKCHTCPIYLSHEDEKYRLISPLIPIGILAIVVLNWNLILNSYQGVAGLMGTAIAHIALGPTSGIAAEWTRTFQTDQFVEYGLLGCATLAIISYALKFIEWAILDQKL
jgi:hypothetical protein